MKITTETLYERLKNLVRKTRDDFRRRGLVIPAKKEDGSIKIGQYLIQRKDNDFYAVVSVDGEIMADQINLPQTAAIIANQLALKKYLNKDIIEKDREYGYAFFEHQLYKRALESSFNNPAAFDIKISKFEYSGQKADLYRQEILSNYQKLQKLV